MTKRKKQQDIEIVPVLFALVILLGFGVYHNQETIILISIFFLSIVTLIGVGLYLFERAKKERLRRSGIIEIDKMSGTEFEKYLQVLLLNSGYKNVIRPSVDLGVDLIATKEGVTWAIQAKRYKGAVGLDAVRQVVAAMSHYKCDKAMVVTNSHFTNHAKTIAASTNCYLLDRNELIKLILAQTNRN